jgi:hypothetical protein
MALLESTVVNSFKLAKTDIMSLQEALVQISTNQERIMEWIHDTRDKEVELYSQLKTVRQDVEKVRNKPAEVLVASKDSNKVHVANCPYARNIKKPSRIFFSDQKQAIKSGYEPCKCLIQA